MNKNTITHFEEIMMIDIANMAAPKGSAPTVTSGAVVVTSDKTTKTKSQKGSDEKYVLANGNAYSKAFSDGLKGYMAAGIKKMRYGKQYTAADICGCSWPKNDPGACKQAGEIIVDMVRKDVFPTIRIAETKHEYPIKYELI